MEFLGGIAHAATAGQTVRLSPAMVQPVASSDVAMAMADAALGALVQRYLTAIGDPRTVVADAEAPYFGVQLDDRSLTPGDDPRLGTTTFETWLVRR